MFFKSNIFKYAVVDKATNEIHAVTNFAINSLKKIVVIIPQEVAVDVIILIVLSILY